MEKNQLIVLYLITLFIFSSDMVTGRSKCQTTEDCDPNECQWGIAVQSPICRDGECFCVSPGTYSGDQQGSEFNHKVNS
ncbi:hypothetical protein P3L10_031177 [Capsicum annuum]